MRPLRTDERLFISGVTGSGKSHFASRIARALSAHSPVLFVDSKGDGQAGKKVKIDALSKKLDSRFFPVQSGIYRIFFDGNDVGDEDRWELLCRRVLARGNVVVWVDEGFMVPDVPGYRRLYTAGRSRNVGMITATQRPVSLPRVAISEATRYFIFQLNDKRDRDTVGAFIPETLPMLARRQFTYYDTADAEFLPRVNT